MEGVHTWQELHKAAARWRDEAFPGRPASLRPSPMQHLTEGVAERHAMAEWKRNGWPQGLLGLSSPFASKHAPRHLLCEKRDLQACLRMWAKMA